MASKLIKISALERLGEILERTVPELRGRVCAGPATRDHRQTFPNAAIVTETFRFMPEAPDEHDYLRLDDDGQPGKLRLPVPGSPVFSVGNWVGNVRIELGAETPQARYRLEHLIEQLFLGAGTGVNAAIGDPGRFERPGTLLVDLDDVPNLWGGRCSFTMDDDSWQNEKAFTNEWFSWLRLDVELPVFVARQNVPLMSSLHLVVELGGISATLAVAADGTVTVIA